MSRYSTVLLAAVASASLIGSSLTAAADNDNPCFQRGPPAGAPYWALGTNGQRCKPFNTYHAPQHDPLAATIDPNLSSKYKRRRVRAKKYFGKRYRR